MKQKNGERDEEEGREVGILGKNGTVCPQKRLFKNHQC